MQTREVHAFSINVEYGELIIRMEEVGLNIPDNNGGIGTITGMTREQAEVWMEPLRKFLDRTAPRGNR